MSRILQIISLFICLTILFSTTVSAHSTSQAGILDEQYISEYEDTYIGGENVGWSIDESLHIGNVTFYFMFSEEAGMQVPASLKQVVRNGALLWSGTASILES